ncbi:hypothetical protein ILUMI_19706 [Ignelater luminosus]|uniref:Uncharacterized protein n=1 Tax=Ignelater luminosus TaxID=2038154 RepID=A0A8K0G2Y6_IGNLU|nr:hypothetical protein ILUMI_19706 [Ignelater luminosus]
MFCNSFFIIKKATGDFSRDNPFAIERIIRTDVGSIKTVRRIKEGLLVETSNFTQAKKIGQMQIFGDQPRPPKLLNRGNSEDGVVEAKRMTTRRNEARKEVMPKGGISHSQAAAKPPSQVTNIVPIIESLIPQITAAKSAPSAVGTSLPPGTISQKSTMPAPSEPGMPKSNTVMDKRKRNESVSTDPGSAREDDLSVIDSSAESNEELSTGKKKKKGLPLGKPRKGSQGGNR